MRKKAFTLAEVLITLVIIGVIAAMTIPTLMGNTNRQETKNKVKKAYSLVNQAMNLEYVLYGNKTLDNWTATSNEKVFQMLTNHISAVETGTDDDGYQYFDTADGIRYTPMYDGVAIRVDRNFDRWVNSHDECSTVEECENLDPNLFFFQIWGCQNINGNLHEYCTMDSITHSYVYDVSIEDAYRQHGNRHTWN